MPSRGYFSGILFVVYLERLMSYPAGVGAGQLGKKTGIRECR